MLYYTNKKPADKQKRRGGYYTPVKLADYLVKWAIREGTERILEPSAGDGNFVVACLEYCQDGYGGCDKSTFEIVAIEIEADELIKGKERVHRFTENNVNIEWLPGDFFSLYKKLQNEKKFDVVLGNPPFIRFQYFEDESRDIAFHHLREVGYKPTKLANAWAAFIQLSIELLKDGGRLAMVVPAELLQVKYAGELRSRLSKQFEHIILMGFKKLVFPEIQQEVLLLLAEGKCQSSTLESDIHTIEYMGGDDLINNGNLDDAIAHIPSKHTRNGMKWTSLFLTNKSFDVLDEAEKSEGLVNLGSLAEVDIGIVTGRNSFFVLKKEQRDKMELQDFTIPLVGRTSALTSITFKKSDFNIYKKQHPAYLLYLVGVEEKDFTPQLIEYLTSGEDAEVHLGYKCRVRKRWSDVPSVYVSDGFMFRQIHRYPLLVVNDAKATSTDTIHRVRFKKEINPHLLAATLFNSLTLAWAEVCGRSYGGGVLELEPMEAEELPVPYDPNCNIDIEKVDSLLRANNEYEALDYVDKIVLKDKLGFDNIMISNIRNAWEELRDRRINRK